MHIQIRTHKVLTASPANGHERTVYSWTLETIDGEVIVQGPQGFHSNAEARTQIARAKKSMKGAWRCKVVDPDEG